MSLDRRPSRSSTSESERSKLGELPRRVFCREKWKTQEVPALDASFFAEHSLRSWECGLECAESLCSTDRTGQSSLQSSAHSVVSSQEHARQLVVKVSASRGEHRPMTERGRQQYPSGGFAYDLCHSTDSYYRRLNDLLNTGWVRYYCGEQSTAERGDVPRQHGGEGTKHASASPRPRVPGAPIDPPSPQPPMSERGPCSLPHLPLPGSPKHPVSNRPLWLRSSRLRIPASPRPFKPDIVLDREPGNATHLTHSSNKCWPDGEPMFKVGYMSTRGNSKVIYRQPRTIHQIITSIQNEGQCLKQDSWKRIADQREKKQDAACISSLSWDHVQSQIPNLKSEFGHCVHQKDSANATAANHVKGFDGKAKFRRMVYHIDASLAEERRDAEYKAKCLKYTKADKFPSHDPETGLPITRFIHF